AFVVGSRRISHPKLSFGIARDFFLPEIYKQLARIKYNTHIPTPETKNHPQDCPLKLPTQNPGVQFTEQPITGRQQSNQTKTCKSPQMGTHCKKISQRC